MFRKMLAAMLGLGMSVVTVWALGPNTEIPFSTEFSGYPLGPIVEGTDGWYPSSTNIVVQTNVFNQSTKAVAIPTDCILSNRFDLTNPDQCLGQDG